VRERECLCVCCVRLCAYACVCEKVCRYVCVGAKKKDRARRHQAILSEPPVRASVRTGEQI